MLLSIIIPTKNRQYTALYAIESALNVHPTDVEVIVQDCSDSDFLRFQIEEKFGNDLRIKYAFDESKPSMTENWNAAFERSSGEYLCGIGDDDAVLENIIELANWAKDNKVKAVTQSYFLIYFWPGYLPQKFNGTLVVPKMKCNNIRIETTYQEQVKSYCSLTNASEYIYLPQAYHCIFSRDVYDSLVLKSGKFLDSTSLDVYTSVAFSAIISEYAVSCNPFTIRGACKNSNTHRLSNNNADEHFKEYKEINWPSVLPRAYNYFTTVCESVISACHNINRPDLIRLIDLPILYANIVNVDRSRHDECKQMLYNLNYGEDEIQRFILEVMKKRKVAFWISIKDRIKGVIPFLQKFIHLLRFRKNIVKQYEAITINHAIVINRKLP